ncbi:MAG TPA: hypothetical protein VGS57_04890 [Thermoanaerobaculia bacterium]|nr:hypothetical protein [Thermoanaerobaculia bacterium]
MICGLALAIGACKRPEQPAGEVTTAEGNATPAAGPSGRVRFVDVALTDHAIEIDGSLPPGPVVFRIRNASKRPRGLVLEGDGKTSRVPGLIQPGELAQLESILQPGLYTLASPGPEPSVVPQQFLVTERARLP